MKLWRLIGIVAALLALPIIALASCANTLIYHPHAEQVAPNFPDTQAVGITTEDHESLVAWYRPPQAHQPIFLFFDGNGGRPQIGSGRWRRIAESGAGFLDVCYRGFSGSSGHPSEHGLHLDAHAGYDWLRRHGYQPSDIVIHARLRRRRTPRGRGASPRAHPRSAVHRRR